jgi:DNA-binding NarL/FixJ family response regulator
MLHPSRILVADSSQYFDSTIWRMLVPEQDFNIVGQAGNIEEALHMAVTLMPDIILADLSHSRMRGLAAVKSLRAAQPGASIIAFSPDSSSEYAQAALAAGASACITKADIADALPLTLYRLLPINKSDSVNGKPGQKTACRAGVSPHFM